MRELAGKLKMAISLGILFGTVGIVGCSLFSASDVPVDCNAVINQEQAGFSDDKIAANLGSTVEKVTACHGQKTAVGPQD